MKISAKVSAEPNLMEKCYWFFLLFSLAVAFAHVIYSVSMVITGNY